MNVLMFSLFASQVLYISGRLTVIRNDKSIWDRELTCFSEDDGAALVWNDIISEETLETSTQSRFYNIHAIHVNKDYLDCKMNENDDCLTKWIRNNWSFTNSFATPLGPVLDQRWEDFQEYGRFDTEFELVQVENASAFSFSVRTSFGVQILLCNDDDYTRSFCYWINIGWGNKRSVVGRCAKTASSSRWSKTLRCNAEITFLHQPLSDTEWRTFLVIWNITTRSISLYDAFNNKIFIRYKDMKYQNNKLETQTMTNSSTFNHYYYMFIQNDNMFYRFHNYSFLHTTIANATLISPVFRFNKMICIQLLFGLCVNCAIDIILYDGESNIELKRIFIKASSKAAHNLPRWEFFTIKYSTDEYNSARIKLTSTLISNTSNPLWAIANVRQSCSRKVSFRKGILESTDYSKASIREWPNVTCQKLSYTNYTVVYTLFEPTSNIKLDDAYCPETTAISPQCLFNCKSYSLADSNDCKGYVICYEEGCTCPPGFTNTSCLLPCDPDRYSYNCKQKCGFCIRDSSSDRICNDITGICINGCIHNKNISYIPPLCKTGLLKPELLKIIAVEKTSIQVKLSLKLAEWRNEGTLFSTFHIRSNGITIDSEWRKVYKKVTELTHHFTQLKPGTIYNIACSLKVCTKILNEEICSFSMQSNWQIVETNCNPAEFELEMEYNNVLIMQKNFTDSTQQYLQCPPNAYKLTVQNKYTMILYEKVEKFPYKVQSLSPDTYIVTLHRKDQTMFSQDIYIFEGDISATNKSSSIFSVRIIDVFDTRVILAWISIDMQGKLMQYEVTIQVAKYLGCKDTISDINNNKTIYLTKNATIEIQNLHPYTLYSAQIVMNEAKYVSKPRTINFQTKQSAIATEVFSNFHIQEWNLIWELPENCSTITGSIYAKIKIRSINDTENFRIIKQTAYNKLHLGKVNLIGAERYVARVYVIRNFNALENPSAYREIEFTIPPGVPPKVNNLEVYEVDDHQTPNIVHLRWQNPTPPLNGILRNYVIRSCNTNHTCFSQVISLNNTCNFWRNYICGSIQMDNVYKIIEVAAYNVDVKEAGSSSRILQEMFNEQTPDTPGNFTIKIFKTGIIDLHWLHPSKTRRPLSYFNITTTPLSTKLILQLAMTEQIKRFSIKKPVKEYMRDYSMRFYLHPSTRYYICIQAVTTRISSKSTCEEFETPSSIGFKDDIKYVIHNTTILLNIPPIENSTKGNIIHIIVKGSLEPNNCEGYLKVPKNLRALAGVDETLVAWKAAELLIQQSNYGISFTIGDNKIYGKAKNCKLHPHTSYDIIVIVTVQNYIYDSSPEAIAVKIIAAIDGESSSIHFEGWIIIIVLIFIVCGASIAVYIYLRKRQTAIKLQNKLVLFHKTENEDERKNFTSQPERDLFHSDRHSRAISYHHYEDIEEITSRIKVNSFDNFVKQAIATGVLDQQFKILSRQPTQSSSRGELPQNKIKNRCETLIPNDDTRVVLKQLPNDPYSDYINANYITGYKKKKHYIATQAPKPNTVIDFWRMIWQENVLIICMLTNLVEDGKIKCEQYWPDVGQKKKYGNIIVLNAMQYVSADYCFRTFQITYGRETRKLEHLHYTAWADHGGWCMPLYTHSLVTYLKKLLATPPGNGPVVVHCSTGVGRTGVIILCDICLRQAAVEGVVDIFAETIAIRSERTNIIHSPQQYLLAHLVLMECLLSVPTTIPCNKILPQRIADLKKQLLDQQQKLQNTAWQDEALRYIPPAPPLSRYNREKNRFPELILDKTSRIYLKRYPTSDENSDYLSGVYVDGVKLQKQYLATQLPMPTTINDFWRMIAEFKVELILMLQPPDPQDSTCCAIAPANGKFKPTPYLNITVKETVEFECYISQKVLLVDNSEIPSRERSVTILCLMEWKPGRNQPPPPVMTMVMLWQATERIARGNGPTVTLCHDGVTGCGLYLALNFLLERMAVEREFDVCLAVRAVRRSRPDFVDSLEQFEYLYDAALTYLEYFETYANFS